MRIYILIVVSLVSGIALNGCAYKQHSKVSKIVDSIAIYGVVEGPLFRLMIADWNESQHFDLSPQYQRLVWLTDSCQSLDLEALTEHTSSVVQCYALTALARRNDSLVIPALLKHLNDSAIVLYRNFDLERKPVSALAKELLSSLLSFYRLRENDHRQIRILVRDSIVSSALVALAKYNDPQDEPVLEENLRKELTKWDTEELESNAIDALKSVVQFPARRFFKHLRSAIEERTYFRRDNVTREYFWMAVVRYPTEESALLCDLALKEVPSHKDIGIENSLVVPLKIALLSHPHPVFQRILDRVQRIHLHEDFENYVQYRVENFRDTSKAP